jgi:hypothetical protein
MKTRSIFPLLIILIAAAEFFISNETLKGYLRSEIFLAREIKTPPQSLHEYRIAEEPPFKYRLIFPALVRGTHDVFFDDGDNSGFFQIYRFWSLFFFVTSCCAFYWLMLKAGFNEVLSLAGTLIYLIMPPMIMAYTLPVHTREDALGYTLFFLGLGFLIGQRRWEFLIVSVLGVVTRETLLLLPLLYLIYGKDESISRKVLITLMPILLWLAIRFAGGPAEYDVWLGLRWNLDNPEQVIGFTFITFNFLWASFFLHYLIYKRNLHYITGDMRFFYRSSLLVLIVLLTTTFLGGIFNEIRLLNLFAPWMIIFFLDCFRNYQKEIRNTLGTKNYKLFALGSLLVCAIMLYFALLYREDLIAPGKYAVPYDQWIIFTVCYTFILLLIVPHLLRIFLLKNPSK